MQAINNELSLMPSTIETIDTGLYRWLDETMNLSTTTNEGFKKTPVIWLGTERSFQIKHDKELRDSVGRLKLPLITINRESFERDPNFAGVIKPNLFERNDLKGGAFTITRRINHEKTRNFANKDKAKRLKTGDETGKSNNKKIVYDEIIIPVPVYVNVSYSIIIRTEYEQQMNDLLAPFLTVVGNSPSNTFFYEIDNHRFEAHIAPQFTENQNSTNLAEEERMFETKVNLKVLGYLIGGGVNRTKPKVTIRESIVEVKISRERVIVGDEIPWKKKDKQYRD